MKFFILILTIFFIFSCNKESNKKQMLKKLEQNSKLIKKNSVLDVSYTYWWPKSGPFIGLCGEAYSLVFLGEVIELSEVTKDESLSYMKQKGKLKIKELLFKKNLKKQKYDNEKFFSSTSFYNSNLKKDDKVLVFVYEYEGHFSIPGKNSIIKIDKFDSPLVNSIKTYIKSGQNPITIKNDIDLWTKYGFGKDLKQVIDCKKHFIENQKIKK